MVIKINDTSLVKNIFKNWEETIIYSCIQKVMGNIYVNDDKNPTSAIAILGDFMFLAGEPNKELVLYKPEGCLQDFIIMIPQNEKWAKLIKQCYKEKAKKVERYAIKKEADTFNKEKLQNIVNSLPKQYTIKLIDEEVYNKCREEEWSRDLVSQYKDYSMYAKKGLGIAIFKGEELVSGASSYSSYNEGIEIEIDTKQEYRRKGLASICGAQLILECFKRNLYPSWDAQNKNSVGLAKKLGYNYSHTYTAYEIWGY